MFTFTGEISYRRSLTRWLGTGLALLALVPSVAFGYRIDTVEVGDTHDFVVGPGKVELTLKPGEQAISTIYVSNRIGETRTFHIETEDFIGSRDPSQTVLLLGGERSPYSLKDTISVPEKTFTLKSGERAAIPVTISIPLGAQPGGRYASVLVSTVTDSSVQNDQGVAPSSVLISRLGTLFFVTVPGNVKRDGVLKDFSLAGGKSVITENAPLTFRLLFENNGSIYLNPYGHIQNKNMTGQEVETLDVSPWFTLPDSLRLREVSWSRPFLFGRYTATARINRGYDSMVDEKTISFWVLPWKIMLGLLIVIIAVVAGGRWVKQNYAIHRKQV